MTPGLGGGGLKTTPTPTPTTRDPRDGGSQPPVLSSAPSFDDMGTTAAYMALTPPLTLDRDGAGDDNHAVTTPPPNKKTRLHTPSPTLTPAAAQQQQQQHAKPTTWMGRLQQAAAITIHVATAPMNLMTTTTTTTTNNNNNMVHSASNSAPSTPGSTAMSDQPITAAAAHANHATSASQPIRMSSPVATCRASALNDMPPSPSDPPATDLRRLTLLRALHGTAQPQPTPQSQHRRTDRTPGLQTRFAQASD
ncbi:hypothetical protein NFJ02_15g20240 [Pycnococcus provasolii]